MFYVSVSSVFMFFLLSKRGFISFGLLTTGRMIEGREVAFVAMETPIGDLCWVGEFEVKMLGYKFCVGCVFVVSVSDLPIIRTYISEVNMKGFHAQLPTGFVWKCHFDPADLNVIGVEIQAALAWHALRRSRPKVGLQTTSCQRTTLQYVSCLRPPWGDVLLKWTSLNNPEYLNTTRILCFNGFHLRRKSPHGDLKQETYRKHPVLSWQGRGVAASLRTLNFKKLLFKLTLYHGPLIFCPLRSSWTLTRSEWWSAQAPHSIV